MPLLTGYARFRAIGPGELARRRTASRGHREVSEMSIDDLRDELQGIPKRPQWASPPSRTGNAAANRRKKLNDWKREHGKRYDELYDELERKLNARRAEAEQIRGERIARTRASLNSDNPISQMDDEELHAYLSGLLELRRALQRGPDTDATRAEHQKVGGAIDRVRRELDDRR